MRIRTNSLEMTDKVKNKKKEKKFKKEQESIE